MELDGSNEVFFENNGWYLASSPSFSGVYHAIFHYSQDILKAAKVSREVQGSSEKKKPCYIQFYYLVTL